MGRVGEGEKGRRGEWIFRGSYLKERDQMESKASFAYRLRKASLELQKPQNKWLREPVFIKLICF